MNIYIVSIRIESFDKIYIVQAEDQTKAIDKTISHAKSIFNRDICLLRIKLIDLTIPIPVSGLEYVGN